MTAGKPVDNASTDQNANGSSETSGTASVAILEDTYGLSTANLLYISDNASFWSVQAADAATATDSKYRCVFRIDVPKGNGFTPSDARTYNIGQNVSAPFPGTFYIFNGQSSTLKRVDSGTITFTDGYGDAQRLNITFDLLFTDNASRKSPPPQYRLRGTISTSRGTGASHLDVGELDQELGETIYLAHCSGCHSLGSFKTTAGSVSDLSQRGGELLLDYHGESSAHQGITLNESDLWRLRVALNAW